MSIRLSEIDTLRQLGFTVTEGSAKFDYHIEGFGLRAWVHALLIPTFLAGVQAGMAAAQSACAEAPATRKRRGRCWLFGASQPSDDT